MLISGPWNDHEVSGRHVLLHYLSDWADRVNNSRTSRVGHELLECRDLDHRNYCHCYHRDIVDVEVEVEVWVQMILEFQVSRFED